MKFLRLAIVLAATLALLASAVHWSRIPAGYVTPADCVEAYATARRQGDIAKLLRCLGEPLGAELRGRWSRQTDLPGTLRSEMSEVKSWVQCLEPLVNDSVAHIDVDEVRTSGTRRIRFRLERTSRGWLITAIDPPKNIPPTIPYGTHVRDISDEPQPKAQP